jgi:hypothetical protein
MLKMLPVEQPEQLYFIQNVGARRSDGGAPPYPCIERFAIITGRSVVWRLSLDSVNGCGLTVNSKKWAARPYRGITFRYSESTPCWTHVHCGG